MPLAMKTVRNQIFHSDGLLVEVIQNLESIKTGAVCKVSCQATKSQLIGTVLAEHITNQQTDQSSSLRAFQSPHE